MLNHYLTFQKTDVFLPTFLSIELELQSHYYSWFVLSATFACLQVHAHFTLQHSMYEILFLGSPVFSIITISSLSGDILISPFQPSISSLGSKGGFEDKTSSLEQGCMCHCYA